MAALLEIDQESIVDYNAFSSSLAGIRDDLVYGHCCKRVRRPEPWPSLNLPFESGGSVDDVR